MSEELKTMRYHANKIFERAESAAEEYEQGRSALGFMEDIAESALYLRNKMDDELSAIKGGGEAVAWMTPSGNVFNNKEAAETGFRGESICKVTPLYTRPPVVAEAEPIRGALEQVIGLIDLVDHQPPVLDQARRILVRLAAYAPPASGAVPVPRELLGRLAENLRGTSIDRPFPTGTYKLLTELRALLAKEVV